MLNSELELKPFCFMLDFELFIIKFASQDFTFKNTVIPVIFPNIRELIELFFCPANVSIIYACYIT